jgi:hypothetical protein
VCVCVCVYVCMYLFDDSEAQQMNVKFREELNKLIFLLITLTYMRSDFHR